MTDTVLALALGLYLGWSPLLVTLVPDVSGYDVQRLVQVTLFLILAARLCSRRAGGSVLGPVSAVLTLIALKCIIDATENDWALRDGGLYIGMYISWIWLKGISNSARDKLIGAIVSGGAVYGVSAVVTLVLCAAVEPFSLKRDIAPGFDNVRALSHLQTVLIPLLLYSVLSPGSMKRALRVGLACQVCLLLWTEGRATLLSLAIGLGVWLLHERTSWQRALVRSGIAASFLAGCVLYALISWAANAAAVPSGYFRASSVATRVDAWRLAIDLATQHPILGVGAMQYAFSPSAVVAHPHNVYLQMLCEWGVPLTALSLCGVARYTLAQYECARRASSSDSARMVLFAGWLAVWIDGFFSGNFVMPLSQTAIAVLAGVMYERRQAHEAGWLEFSVGLGSVAMWRFASCVLLTWCAWQAGKDYTRLDVLLAAARSHVYKAVSQPDIWEPPRFWSNGWVPVEQRMLRNR